MARLVRWGTVHEAGTVTLPSRIVRLAAAAPAGGGLAIDPSTPPFAAASNDPWVTDSFTPPVGSLIVLVAVADWFSSTPTLVPTSSGLTFDSPPGGGKFGAINNGVVQIWTADVGAAGGTPRTISVTTNITSDVGGIKAYVLTGQHVTSPVDTTGTAGPDGTNNWTPTVLTTGFDGCWVLGGAVNWVAAQASTSTDVFEQFNDVDLSIMAARKATATSPAGAVTLNFDQVAAGTPIWTFGAISIRPADGGGGSVNADAALTATATLTATGVRAANAAAALTATATITATATVTRTATASLTGTATFTAAATVGTGPINADATLTATANITATATVTRPAASSLTVTATRTATAAIARPAAAALTATAGITAAATVVKSASAALTATATHTATATTVRVATASLTATATITADGAVGVVALLTATATITATAVRAAAASATLTATATRTAAATVTRPASGSVTATAAITATATVTRASTATVTGVATITATATVTGPVAAVVPRPDAGTTTRPASTFVARPFAGTTPRP